VCKTAVHGVLERGDARHPGPERGRSRSRRSGRRLLRLRGRLNRPGGAAKTRSEGASEDRREHTRANQCHAAIIWSGRARRAATWSPILPGCPRFLLPPISESEVAGGQCRRRRSRLDRERGGAAGAGQSGAVVVDVVDGGSTVCGPSPSSQPARRGERVRDPGGFEIRVAVAIRFAVWAYRRA